MIRPRCRFCLTYVECFGDICTRCAEACVQDDEMVRLIEMDLEQLRERADET